MALNSIPDYSFKGGIDSSIVNAYQQKAVREEEMRRSNEAQKQAKIAQVSQIFNQGAALVGALQAHSQAAQTKLAQDAVAKHISNPSGLEPTGEMSPAKSSFFPNMTEATTAKGAYTPQDMNDLRALLYKADPEEGAKRANEAAWKNTENQRGMVSGRDIQQFHLVSPDGEERIPVTYDEVTREMRNVVTDEPIDRKAYANYQMVKAAQQVKQDAAGNWQVIDPTLGRTTNTLSSGAPEVPKAQYGTVKEINNPLVPKEDRKDIVNTIVRINHNPAVKNAIRMLPMLSNVEDFLNTDNEVAVDRLGGLTQKMIALDSGNLAAWEQRDPGSRSIIERLRQFASMHAQGRLTAKNKAELVEVLKITRENLAINVEVSAGMELNQMLELYPYLNKEAMYKKAGIANLNKYVRPLSGNDLGDGFSYTEK
jgi:hypothetical protein